MTTFRIAEVAEQTGVPSTTIRYYEEIGLLAPAERARNGYRAYTDRDIERLHFITRAKNLQISLDELRNLVTAWDSDNCNDVQFRMADVVTQRLAETRRRVAELLELADQLQAASERLSSSPRAGACDDGCACVSAATGATTRFALTLTERRS